MVRGEPYRIFLLSPARVGGRRTEMLFNPHSSMDLAHRVQNEGAELGEVFTFLSGLYFRGKLLYANHFARPYRRLPGTWVITSNRGLVPAKTIITAEDLVSLSGVPIDPADKRYVSALQESADKLSKALPQNCEVVLLGSIGTKKYAEILLKFFDLRLKFPISFVGRGDMSRGGLLLRSVSANQPLEYVPLSGAVRHGKRPPKLERIIRTKEQKSQ